jgi:LPS export ABC transporter protein LptC
MVCQTQVLLALSTKRLNHIFSGFFLPAFFFLFSCSKAPQPNEALNVRADDPVMSAHNIDVLFSDSGKVQAQLTSSLMNRYAGESPFLEFPAGFKIFMFDSVQQISSTITGNRGIRREHSRIMEAWGNVVVRNEKKNEQINTEHLIWDENRHRIWSDVKVKITRPDQTLYGTSMESNEAFTDYSIQGVTGEMAVKKDSI